MLEDAQAFIAGPYHAHSHIFPGVLSDAGPAGNETGNDTVLTPLLPIASSPTPVHGIGTPIPTFSMKTLSRTVGCGKTADCDAKLHEQCINGTCIARKHPEDSKILRDPSPLFSFYSESTWRGLFFENRVHSLLS